MRELADYEQSNAAYVAWWAGFVASVEAALPTTAGRWVLTGSRSFGLAYPESDIEGAVLCATDEQPDLQEGLRTHLLASGMRPDVTTTSAGLRMVTLRDVHRDATLDIWQVEITLRTEEVHRQITTHVERELATWSPERRVAYIDAQRADFARRHHDPAALERYQARKQWLRVLAPRD